MRQVIDGVPPERYEVPKGLFMTLQIEDLANAECMFQTSIENGTRQTLLGAPFGMLVINSACHGSLIWPAIARSVPAKGSLLWFVPRDQLRATYTFNSTHQAPVLPNSPVWRRHRSPG